MRADLSDSPTMMCRAEVTGSLVPTVAKQMQSVEPAAHGKGRAIEIYDQIMHQVEVRGHGSGVRVSGVMFTCGDDSDSQGGRHQHLVGGVGVTALIALHAAQQAVHDFAEHPIPAYTHHAGVKWSEVKGELHDVRCRCQ